MTYNPKDIEQKWQDWWQVEAIYTVSDTTDAPKCYVLDMFPYPSGAGLHVGHPKGYIATDIYSRFKKMNGFNVLHPMGWDAFGLPAENYAIKNKVHPSVAVEKNIEVFKAQLSKIGFNFDWNREINTTDPAYYKWTQWCVAKMFEAGLMEEVHEPIIWCPECQTGLAFEDLEDGKCERCGSAIEKKNLRQWVIKITRYADKLLEGLDDLDWEEGIKESQRNWIGKSEGATIRFRVKCHSEQSKEYQGSIANVSSSTGSFAGAQDDSVIEVFTTRPDTLFGVMFMVIAPEHPLVHNLEYSITNLDEVKQYVATSAAKTDLDREVAKEKTGVKLEGITAINPVNNEDIPVYIADYVMMGYGTGAIMAVPAHDERDFAFAKKYEIDIKYVVCPPTGSYKISENNYQTFENSFVQNKDNYDFITVWMEENYSSGYTNQFGYVFNSDFLNGKTTGEAKQTMIAWLEQQEKGTRKINYKLRDWVFARQRYWGEPFPFIHKKDGTIDVVPESELPVTLPNVNKYEPTGTGESPLAAIEDWVNTAEGRRETNTMPQWAGSSWYYLRYIDPKNNEMLVAPDKEQYWMGDRGVDLYIGGAEHATRHLIYARFWHKFLYDQGVVSTPEPFHKLINVGLIMAEDGRKMSKRWNNVINPDDVIDQYGADSFRIYEMFIGPFTQSAAWNTRGVEGVYKFLNRYVRLYEKELVDTEIDVQERIIHKAIKKVGDDIQQFSFNTAIAEMMIVVNELTKCEQVQRSVLERLNRILAPFAVHLTEELHHTVFGAEGSIHHREWPTYDESKLVQDTITIVVQVNGKVRDQLEVSSTITKEEAEAAALASEKVQGWLDGKDLKKIIYVPGKLVSIVV
jgi:leucyl-tRNA synthetase